MKKFTGVCVCVSDESALQVDDEDVEDIYSHCTAYIFQREMSAPCQTAALSADGSRHTYVAHPAHCSCYFKCRKGQMESIEVCLRGNHFNSDRSDSDSICVSPLISGCN